MRNEDRFAEWGESWNTAAGAVELRRYEAAAQVFRLARAGRTFEEIGSELGIGREEILLRHVMAVQLLDRALVRNGWWHAGASPPAR